MQQINVSELIPHPNNDYFFDDITGEAWTAFLQSISTSGVIEPIVITQDKLIVSGHQRVRACKELNIPTILAEIHIYSSEDQILKDLLETNIRQRGIGNPNPIKLGRCIKELERIYGFKEGRPPKLSKDFTVSDGTPKNESELAEFLGITRQTIQNYKKLTELIPELEDLVDTGILSPTTAVSLVKYMSPDEQEAFVSSLDTTKKITQKQVQQYIEQSKSKELSYQSTISSLESQISKLSRQLTLYQEDAEHYSTLKSQIDFLSKQRDDLSRQIASATELASLTVKLQKLLEEDLAPIKYKRCMERLDSPVAIQNLKDIISNIEAWTAEMKLYTEGEFIYE